MVGQVIKKSLSVLTLRSDFVTLVLYQRSGFFLSQGRDRFFIFSKQNYYYPACHFRSILLPVNLQTSMQVNRYAGLSACRQAGLEVCRLTGLPACRFACNYFFSSSVRKYSSIASWSISYSFLSVSNAFCLSLFLY